MSAAVVRFRESDWIIMAATAVSLSLLCGISFLQAPRGHQAVVVTRRMMQLAGNHASVPPLPGASLPSSWSCPMPTPRELEDKFWSALKSDRMMLGLDGVEDGHARPMTAQVEGEKGPIWFFTARDNAIVQKLELGDRVIATFAVIDRLWNRFVAAWYDGGKDDPKLALLRFDAERAEIWLDA
jgi:general stress protein 26